MNVSEWLKHYRSLKTWRRYSVTALLVCALLCVLTGFILGACGGWMKLVSACLITVGVVATVRSLRLRYRNERCKRYWLYITRYPDGTFAIQLSDSQNNDSERILRQPGFHVAFPFDRPAEAHASFGMNPFSPDEKFRQANGQLTEWKIHPLELVEDPKDINFALVRLEDSLGNSMTMSLSRAIDFLRKVTLNGEPSQNSFPGAIGLLLMKIWQLTNGLRSAVQQTEAKDSDMQRALNSKDVDLQSVLDLLVSLAGKLDIGERGILPPEVAFALRKEIVAMLGKQLPSDDRRRVSVGDLTPPPQLVAPPAAMVVEIVDYPADVEAPPSGDELAALLPTDEPPASGEEPVAAIDGLSSTEGQPYLPPSTEGQPSPAEDKPAATADGQPPADDGWRMGDPE